jgi:hypothetical protein
MNNQYNNGQYNNIEYNRNGQYNNGQYNNGQYNNSQYNNDNSFTDTAFTGFKWYGYMQGVYIAICGCIIICIMYFVSYSMYKNSLKYDSPIIEAIVTKANCITNRGKKGEITYSCGLTVSYIINNINYSNNLNINQNRAYYINDKIKIKYNIQTKNPNDIIEYNVLNNTSSSVMLFCCTFICCILLMILVYYIFTNEKVAATYGAATAFGQIVD